MSNYKRYGLTLEQYEALKLASGNTCYICHRPPKKRSLCVDHNHKTGLVRGLLCHYCNKYLIGRVTDPKVFYEAAKYLEGAINIGGYVKPKKRKRRR